jgi:D-beta-D-heptose 7-phosphate kinase/D-beta-D-heptose 1-phosphate adenosyltransferase
MTISLEMFDKESKDRPTIMVSGGFDPVHVGHIRLILDAAKFGDVIVIANSDQWLYRKKGFVFMTFNQRKEILDSIKGVVLVDSVNDTDGTVCEAIRRLKPAYFANGGDRKKTNTPEVDVCNELGIELLWGVGGNSKSASSSDLVNRARLHQNEDNTPVRTETIHSER